MKRFILGVAAALVLSAGPAAADGLPSKGAIRAPAVAAGPNWNGFYVGVGIGAGAMVTDVSASFYHGGGMITSSSSYHGGGDLLSINGLGGEGVFGTVTVGYDRVIRPGWVGGVFADYDFGSGISGDFSFLHILRGAIDHNYSWAVGGRLGFLTNPATLVYATAGYTQAEFEALTTDTFSGYFVGAGVETFLRDNWTLKLEYRYSDFDNESYGDYFTVDVDPAIHSARLVLSYKFGHRD